MTEEKIIEIARRHMSVYKGDHTYSCTSGDLIAFAQSVIKEERTRVNQIIDDGYRQGGHLKWLCAIAIVERIKEKAE